MAWSWSKWLIFRPHLYFALHWNCYIWILPRSSSPECLGYHAALNASVDRFSCAANTILNRVTRSHQYSAIHGCAMLMCDKNAVYTGLDCSIGIVGKCLEPMTSTGLRKMDEKYFEHTLANQSVTFMHCKDQIPLRYPDRRQVRGWSQTCRRPASSC